MRQMHAALSKALFDELRMNRQWAVYDMKTNFAEMIQFMKQSAKEQSDVWMDYEGKLNPY